MLRTEGNPAVGLSFTGGAAHAYHERQNMDPGEDDRHKPTTAKHGEEEDGPLRKLLLKAENNKYKTGQ